MWTLLITGAVGGCCLRLPWWLTNSRLLCFGAIRLSSDVLLHVIDMVEANGHIETLALSENTMSFAVCRRLSSLLRRFDCLDTLELSHVGLTDAMTQVQHLWTSRHTNNKQGAHHLIPATATVPSTAVHRPQQAEPEQQQDRVAAT